MNKELHNKLKFAASYYQKFAFLMAFFCGAFAHAQTPLFSEAISIEGRVMKDNVPVNGLVDVVFEVSTEANSSNPGRCVLYRDTHDNVNVGSTVTDNQGFFNLKLGTGGAVQVWNGAMTSVFTNRAGTPILGESGCSVTPVAGTKRYVTIMVKLDAESTYSELGTVEMSSVPTAMVAETLQGHYSSDFFLNPGADATAKSVNTAKLASLLANDLTNLGNLPNILNGSSPDYVQTNANATATIPSTSSPPSPSAGQMWFDTTTNTLKYYDGTSTKEVGTAGAGVMSVTAGAGLSGGTITSSGTIAIATGGVTDAMLAGSISGSKITAGTFLRVDGTEAMTGALNLNANDVTAAGHIMMNNAKIVRLGNYTSSEQATLTGTTLPSNMNYQGSVWYNSDTDRLMYWNGSAARAALDSAQLQNGHTGSILTTDIFPMVACTDSQKLKISAGPVYTFSCVEELPRTMQDADGDTRIRVEASADEDTIRMATAGTERITISSTGLVGVGTTAPSSTLDVAGAITARPIGTTTGSGGQIKFRELVASGSDSVTLRAPDTLAASYALTLPGDDGTNGQVLLTDGNGNLSWSTPAAVPVTSVFSRTGAVVAAAGDYTASQITNVAAGTIAAATTQAAINELDSEKVSKAGDTLTGDLTLSAQADVRFGDGDSNWAAIQAPSGLSANYTLTLPADDGSANQVLTTNGSGVLSWQTDGGGTVTSVTAGTGLLIGTVAAASITTTGTINVNVGTGANQIVQLDSSSRIPAVNGSLVTNLNAGNLASGTIPAARMPAFTGDVTASAGSTALTISTGVVGPTELAQTGVTAATYGSATTVPVIAVDADGRITSATNTAISVSATSLPMSGLTAATATNTINNANFNQVWGWNSLTTGTGLTVNSSSLTSGTLMSVSDTGTVGTGSILNLSTANAGSNSTPLVITNNGGGNSFRVNDAASDSTPFVIDDDGNVAIGKTSTSRKFEVVGSAEVDALYTTTITSSGLITANAGISSTNITASGTLSGDTIIGGQIVGGVNAITSVNADFGSSNNVVISSGLSNASVLNITNMTSGGSYTILITQKQAAVHSYTLGGLCNGKTKGKPAGTVTTTANTETIITIMYLNTFCYVAWESGW